MFRFNTLRRLSTVQPQFVVGETNGFLPISDPLVKLPAEFATLEHLLDEMPLKKKNGQKGLLATGDFGSAVDKELKVR